MLPGIHLREESCMAHSPTQIDGLQAQDRFIASDYTFNHEEQYKY